MLNKQIYTELGKLPPQAVEIEELLLGCLLIEPNRWNDINQIVTIESFYKDIHSIIYKAINELMSENKKCDLVLVTEQLRKNDELDIIGGALYITKLTNRIGSAANIIEYAVIIKDNFIKREFIRISTEIQNIAYDSSIDISELIEFSESSIFKINNEFITNEAEHIKYILQGNVIEIETALYSEDHLLGITSGYSKLDRITNGWQKSDLIIIAARPSMGKTAFMLSFAKSAALNNKNVGIFSLEMSKNQLTNRLLSSEIGITPMILKSGRFDKNKIDEVIVKSNKLSKLNIYIDDTPGLSIVMLSSRAKKIVMKYKIDIVFIDYLQLMSGSGKSKGNREQEISEISRKLKELAKVLNIPIIALSQLNRSVEMRGGMKRPQLSDLRESGSIEQDADLVAFIHRPEKYQIMEYEDGLPTKNTTEIILAKHRNGAIGSVIMYNNESMTRITDFEEQQKYYDADLFIEPNIKFEDEEAF